MKFKATIIPEVVEILPNRFTDRRGFFSEIFRQDEFDRKIGAQCFLQENESLSRQVGTIRGLHFQTAPFAQGKLVRCLAGAIFDVAVDLRVGSESFGHWIAVELSAEAGNQLWIPVGFAHGFCTLTPDARVCYKVTAPYSPQHDSGVAWDDPEFGIEWPPLADRTTLSDKDQRLPRLAETSAPFKLQDSQCA